MFLAPKENATPETHSAPEENAIPELFAPEENATAIK